MKGEPNIRLQSFGDLALLLSALFGLDKSLAIIEPSECPVLILELLLKLRVECLAGLSEDGVHEMLLIEHPEEMRAHQVIINFIWRMKRLENVIWVQSVS